MKMKRRGFFASLLAAPAVAVAAQEVIQTGPPKPTIRVKTPYLFSEARKRQLICDALQSLGCIRPGEDICANDAEICGRMLADADVYDYPYHVCVAKAAEILRPLYAVTVGTGYLKITQDEATARCYLENGHVFYKMNFHRDAFTLVSEPADIDGVTVPTKAAQQQAFQEANAMLDLWSKEPYDARRS